MERTRGVGEDDGSGLGGLGGQRAWGEESFQPGLRSLVCEGRAPQGGCSETGTLRGLLPTQAEAHA